MNRLNYHHLLYFWTVAKKGSIVAACAELELRQPTVSAQIQALEEDIGEKLFDRVGRRLFLTEAGRTVFRYAEQIFSLGTEMIEVMSGKTGATQQHLVVGINDVVPKFITHRLLKVALHLKQKVHLVCKEDSADRLFAELAIHNIDLVISDAPIKSTNNIKGYSHFLGESGVSFMAASDLAKKYKKNFPKCLHGAPLLLPTSDTSLRGQIDEYFHRRGIEPNIIAEFADSALLNMFGSEGEGIFVVSSAIEKEVKQVYGVDVIVRVPSIKERFYLITVSRQIKNPAVQAISALARKSLFPSS